MEFELGRDGKPTGMRVNYDFWPKVTDENWWPLVESQLFPTYRWGTFQTE